jgi:hypothetical protein
MLAKAGAKFVTNWDKYLNHVLAFRVLDETPRINWRISINFYLLYGRDVRIPTETALSTPRAAYQIDLDDYKTELCHSLTTVWEIAKGQIKKAKKKQKHYYDRSARTRDLVTGDRVTVLMPRDHSGRI